MKLTLKLRQDPQAVVSQMANDLIRSGYKITFVGPNSMLLCKEGEPIGKVWVRLFITGRRSLEVIKRVGG